MKKKWRGTLLDFLNYKIYCSSISNSDIDDIVVQDDGISASAPASEPSRASPMKKQRLSLESLLNSKVISLSKFRHLFSSHIIILL